MIHRIPTQNDPKWTPPEGPFAFPWQGVGYFDTGMTLRDWFAGQALAGLLSDAKMAMAGDVHLLPATAYVFADKMLAARTQEKG